VAELGSGQGNPAGKRSGNADPTLSIPQGPGWAGDYQAQYSSPCGSGTLAAWG
jgi:hypothetical protein